MQAFITALTTAVTSNTLWATVTDAAPMITVAVLFSFGYRVLRHVIAGVSKGKARI